MNLTIAHPPQANCSAMIFAASPQHPVRNMRRYAERIAPWGSRPDVPPSVAAAMEAAVAREAAALPAGKPVSQAVLRSSLAGWRCAPEGAEWSQRARASRRAAVETHRLHRRTAAEAGGAARRCESDWDVELPDLQAVAHIGHDPQAAPGPRQLGDAPGVTLVTQVALSRLHVLEDQCRLWKGLPMAAAIYVPLSEGRPEGYAALDAAVADVLRAARRLEAAAAEGEACYLAADVLVEDICAAGTPEPSNALRNRALRLVATRAVFLSDGQHLVGNTLVSMLSNKESLKEVLAAAEATAGVVVPAYAPTRPWYGNIARQLAVEIVESSYRGGVMKGVKSKELRGPLGWGLEDAPGAMDAAFKNWSHQKGNTLNTTAMGDGAAPLAVMLTSRVPWLDERARGVGWAQALHVRHAEALANSTTWTYMANAWAIRLAPQEDEVGRQGGAAQARANKALFARFKAAVAKGTYLPAVGVEELCYI